MPKVDEWRAHIARCEADGQGVASYCASHGLKPRTMLWWRSELRRREIEGRTGHKVKPAKKAKKSRSKSSEVKLAKVICRGGGSNEQSVPPAGAVRIALAGAEVSVDAGSDRDALRMALEVLREVGR